MVIIGVLMYHMFYNTSTAAVVPTFADGGRHNEVKRRRLINLPKSTCRSWDRI